MTTNLEKQFFDTFGIEETYFEHFHGDGYDYPQITDRILLNLLCYVQTSPYFTRPISWNSIDKVKEDVLIGLIIIMNLDIHEKRKEKVKQDIQKIFKEQ